MPETKPELDSISTPPIPIQGKQGDFGQPNVPVPPSPQKPVRTVFLVCLLIIIIAIAGWFFWSSRQSNTVPAQVLNTPKVTNSASNFKLPTSTPVTNFKNYTSNTLPPQFPSDFPNPAKPGSVLNNFSMVLQSAVSTQMSIFKFTTTDTTDNLVKLYQDYFTKNGWSANVKQINNGVWLSGIKDQDFAGVIITRSATATTTTVTLNINSH